MTRRKVRNWFTVTHPFTFTESLGDSSTTSALGTRSDIVMVYPRKTSRFLPVEMELEILDQVLVSERRWLQTAKACSMVCNAWRNHLSSHMFKSTRIELGPTRNDFFSYSATSGTSKLRSILDSIEHFTITGPLRGPRFGVSVEDLKSILDILVNIRSLRLCNLEVNGIAKPPQLLPMGTCNLGRLELDNVHIKYAQAYQFTKLFRHISELSAAYTICYTTNDSDDYLNEVLSDPLLPLVTSIVIADGHTLRDREFILADWFILTKPAFLSAGVILAQDLIKVVTNYKNYSSIAHLSMALRYSDHSGTSSILIHSSWISQTLIQA